MEHIASYLQWRKRLNEEELFSAFAASYGQGHTAFNFPPTNSAYFRQRGEKTWLRRIYREEEALAENIRRRLGQRPPPAIAVPSELNEGQKRAFRAALSANFLIINGGPGTGKTYTLARLVQARWRAQPNLTIGLCAPTGKAAQRMAESLAQQGVKLEEAKTVHRLIGYSNGAVLHDEKNPLAQQLIIVDEASMLSSALAQQLFAAVSPESQLILLGDGRQLAAVEPGAVLNDLINNEFLRDYVVSLTESQRFSADSAIGGLVRELQRELPDLGQVCHWARALGWREKFNYAELFAGYEPYLQALEHGDEDQLLAAFNDFRVLTTMNQGPWGTAAINRELGRLHCQGLGLAPEEFFHGLPLMVLANDYQLNLFNGDIGLCLGHGEERRVRFPQKTVALRHLNPAQLAPAYALTIHKAQGSEFRRVALVLQDSEKLLSRELFYTGVSRARAELQLYASPWALREACQRPTLRQTGLNDFLTGL